MGPQEESKNQPWGGDRRVLVLTRAPCSVGKGWRWGPQPWRAWRPGILLFLLFFLNKRPFKLPGAPIPAGVLCSQSPARLSSSRECPSHLPPPPAVHPSPQPSAPSGSWLSHAESFPSTLLPRVEAWFHRPEACSLPAPCHGLFLLTPPAFPAQVL